MAHENLQENNGCERECEIVQAEISYFGIYIVRTVFFERMG